MPGIFLTIAALALFLFLFFAGFEYRLHLYIERFMERARELRPVGFWARRPRYRITITLLLIGLYGVVAAHWVRLAFSAPTGCP